MGISRSIADLERAFFVGREKEIQLMQKHALGDWPWLWLHIYGPSEIGKSSLLKRFKSEISDSYYIYLDGHKRIYQKEDLLNQLTQQLIEEGECLLSETHEEETMKLIREKAPAQGRETPIFN